jgi:predicted secreted Zn-dependent protease
MSTENIDKCAVNDLMDAVAEVQRKLEELVVDRSERRAKVDLQEMMDTLLEGITKMVERHSE